MPGRTSRSQKAATQASQPAPSQRQRASRHNQPVESDEEEQEQDGNQTQNGHDEDQEMEDEDGGAPGSSFSDELERKANDLVRLALFTEQKRMPLRRDDITKKVLGQNGARVFKVVFVRAQHILRKTFGMDLVELPSRAELAAESNEGGKDGELEEARKATGLKKKAAAAGSKTYILRSILHPTLISYAALTDESILEEEIADAPDSDDENEDSGVVKNYGSIISWSQADQLGSIGILYVILTLILVNGRVITEMDLRANLKRLRLPTSASIQFTSKSTHKHSTVDAYLAVISKQGYVERSRIGDAPSGKGGKRGRAPAATQANNVEEGVTYEWRWGNRAHSEVGEAAIASFAAEFMVERNDEGGERSEAQRLKELEKMSKGIERAAGGELAEIK